MITNSDGALAHRYRYLQTMIYRGISSTKLAKKEMMISLNGHLFDSGLINKILDVAEFHGHGVSFEQCNLPPRCGSSTMKSSVLLNIQADDESALNLLESEIRCLVDFMQSAEAEYVRLDYQNDCNAVQTSSNIATVEGPKREKRVLLLGAGHVSKSFVDLLSRSTDSSITVVSDNEEDARAVADTASKGHAVGMDIMNNLHLLSDLIEESDLVVSLLPAPMHPSVALECILHQRNMITASYESEEMRALHDRAKEAGIVILNEVGLDPGLDHMSAMKIIHEIQHRGGKVTRFSSVCGGLPAPEAANNPLQYKFSWSPRGVIRACGNPASYCRDGKVINVSSEDLLRSAEPSEVFSELDLECLPNRNSLHYEDIYGINGASTLFRGTLRYRGFSNLMRTLQQMGLMSDNVTAASTWDELLAILGETSGASFANLNSFVLSCAESDNAEADRALACLSWLGMIGECKIAKGIPVVDSFCAALQRRMTYSANERDMVVMHHTIEAVFDDGTEESHLSSLKVFGDSTHSAMSKTVGFTTAASAELILSCTLEDERGLVIPTIPKVYLPILESVAKEGIVFEESMISNASKNRA